MRKVRVLEMIDRPFLGGGQAHLLAIAGSLRKDRFDVLVGAAGGGPLEDEARRSGLEYVRLPVEKSLNLGSARAIARALAGREVDILHTHGGVAGLFGRWAARIAGTPVVVHTLHGIHYLHYRNPALRRIYVLIERYLARRTDAVIFVSDADAGRGRRFRLAPAAKMRVIKNGIDYSSLPESSRSSPALENLRSELMLDSPLVVSVARLHRQKGVIHLLRAAPEILRASPGAKIAVVGGGPLETKLGREADDLGLDRRFLLLGERSDAREVMALADVFVLPSLWEGLPLVLLEAAALGKPIVATDIDGVREVLRDGDTGILVPPADPDALAAAVTRLVRDKSLASGLAERARADIPPRFTLAAMTAAVEDLYLELAAAKKIAS